MNIQRIRQQLASRNVSQNSPQGASTSHFEEWCREVDHYLLAPPAFIVKNRGVTQRDAHGRPLRETDYQPWTQDDVDGLRPIDYEQASQMKRRDGQPYTTMAAAWWLNMKRAWILKVCRILHAESQGQLPPENEGAANELMATLDALFFEDRLKADDAAWAILEEHKGLETQRPHADEPELAEGEWRDQTAHGDNPADAKSSQQAEHFRQSRVGDRLIEREEPVSHDPLTYSQWREAFAVIRDGLAQHTLARDVTDDCETLIEHIDLGVNRNLIGKSMAQKLEAQVEEWKTQHLQRLADEQEMDEDRLQEAQRQLMERRAKAGTPSQ